MRMGNEVHLHVFLGPFSSKKNWRYTHRTVILILFNNCMPSCVRQDGRFGLGSVLVVHQRAGPRPQ